MFLMRSTPPLNPVLRVLPCQFSLRQVVPDALQPPSLWSSSPSFSRYLHRHHSLAYVFVFSSQYMPTVLLYPLIFLLEPKNDFESLFRGTAKNPPPNLHSLDAVVDMPFFAKTDALCFLGIESHAVFTSKRLRCFNQYLKTMYARAK